MRFVFALFLMGILVTLGADKPQTHSHDVSIANLRYSPPELSIAVGDTVVWTNNDDRDHTAIAKDGSFNSGVIHRGQSFSHTFDKPGTHPYGCRLHPRMGGTITVLQKQ